MDVYGLDVGVNGAGAEMSPDYAFRVWITTAPGGVFSNGSNVAASKGSLPPTLIDGLVSNGSSGPGSGWQATVQSPGAGTDVIYGVSKDPSGNAYVTGASGNKTFFRKFDPSGNPQLTIYKPALGLQSFPEPWLTAPIT